MALVILLAWSAEALAADGAVCPTTPVAPLTLPVTKAAIATRHPVIVVTLGSSSTRGAGASDPAHSYPAILQAEIAKLMPSAAVSVINRGVDGEDARKELARVETDVVALRPSLVIWQVGANGAMRHSDPLVFKAVVEKGVGLMGGAGSDVVLMDNQRAAQILKSPNRLGIEAALADAARETGSNLFSRGGLMDAWRDQGIPYDVFIGPDGLHHNDRGYRCFAEALARAIVAAASP